jgi:soluble lytic murein transglycosylase-like protein
MLRVLATVFALALTFSDFATCLSTAFAANAVRTEPAGRPADFITEAARRFAIPEHWIRVVMQTESGCDEHAISNSGAMGLMQIMPGTWVELSVRYGLGLDPFDPHDNILVGAAYLRELHDRFGSAGFLAAYNAGPERYQQHLSTGRPLPPETLAYVSAIETLLSIRDNKRSALRIQSTASWRQSPLFIERSDATSDDDRFAARARFSLQPDARPRTVEPTRSSLPAELFVHLSNDGGSP